MEKINWRKDPANELKVYGHPRIGTQVNPAIEQINVTQVDFTFSKVMNVKTELFPNFANFIKLFDFRITPCLPRCRFKIFVKCSFNVVQQRIEVWKKNTQLAIGRRGSWLAFLWKTSLLNYEKEKTIFKKKIMYFIEIFGK